ncbi:hypothetical protein [Lacticaseibacillus kribbianus]|uniref:hypothetical protein n=1 Tax=Lacticaseibacillus kribbianus TaxID=2926292 RepID=UPI001CD2D0F9|nr:hypothetical protein [Lacticaseibacillus kribbianus]
MHGLLALELKKQPWLLHLAALIGLVLMFAVPLGHTLGILPTTYHYMRGMRIPNYATTSEKAMVDALPRRLEDQVTSLRQFNHNDTATLAIKVLGTMKKPLAEHDFVAVNRLALNAINKHPELAEMNDLGTFIYNDYTTPQLQLETMQKVLGYYVKHDINALPAVAEQTTAMAKVHGLFSRYGSHVYKWTVVQGQKHYFYKLNAGTTLTWIFLCYVALVMAAVFGFDTRHQTENLMRMTPRGDLRMAATRAGLTLAAIAVVLAAVFGLALAVNAVVPGTVLGSIWQPAIHSAVTGVTLTPMWQDIVWQLGVWWAWAAFLSGVAFLVTQFTGNLLMTLTITAATFFIAPLHALDVLPVAVQKLLPAFYTNPPALLAHADPFGAATPATAFIILAAWTAAAWLLAGAVQRVRYRKLVLGH